MVTIKYAREVEIPRECHNLEESFLALINAEGFAKYRKTFIHDVKNMAWTLDYPNFFIINPLEWEGRVSYQPELVPNHQVHKGLKGEHPEFLPGVAFPLDVDMANDIYSAQLLVSVMEGFADGVGFGTTMAVRYQIVGVHRWQYIYFTPKELGAVLEQITNRSI